MGKRLHCGRPQDLHQELTGLIIQSWVVISLVKVIKKKGGGMMTYSSPGGHIPVCVHSPGFGPSTVCEVPPRWGKFWYLSLSFTLGVGNHFSFKGHLNMCIITYTPYKITKLKIWAPTVALKVEDSFTLAEADQVIISHELNIPHCCSI